MPTPLRWAVVLIDFDPATGHEQAGTRRALVVSYEPFPVLGHGVGLPDDRPPAEVPRAKSRSPSATRGQTKPGLVLCDQVRTVDLVRVTAFQLAGRVQTRDPAIRQGVRAALMHHLGLDIPAEADGAA